MLAGSGLVVFLGDGGHPWGAQCGTVLENPCPLKSGNLWSE